MEKTIKSYKEAEEKIKRTQQEINDCIENFAYVEVMGYVMDKKVNETEKQTSKQALQEMKEFLENYSPREPNGEMHPAYKKELNKINEVLEEK